MLEMYSWCVLHSTTTLRGQKYYPRMNLVAHVLTTYPSRPGRPLGLFNQGAAGAMRAHLAKYVAFKLNLRPVTYSPSEYRSLMHGPVMP